MTKTLLAVDDSVTMRKVLEITFSGEDYRVVSAENTQQALGKLSENPSVVVIDTTVGGEDGYALAKEMRKRSAATAIILLASRYAPYDQAKGRDAGADDWADKPFDTQQLIDKVRKALAAKESGAAAPAPVPAPAASPMARPLGAAPSPGLPRGTQQSLSSAAPRTGTLVFGEGNAPAPGPMPARTPAQAAASAASSPAPPPVAASHVGAAVNGQLAGKLGELGLTPQQADAVLALSREVVERIVWEVVPQIAEALIKEEIARLTRE